MAGPENDREHRLRLTIQVKSDHRTESGSHYQATTWYSLCTRPLG